MEMILFALILLFSTITKDCNGSFEANIDAVEQTDNEWDVLIFTQRWPTTSCYMWRKSDIRHECHLPTTRNAWTIHGIWPTKFGEIGPTHCNKSVIYDPDVLLDIKPQLTEFWINVEKGTDDNSFWKHEWLKHGTCSLEIPALATQVQYFGQGLNWLQQYTMSSVLHRAGIEPDTLQTVKSFYDGIKGVLGVNPAIECDYDSTSGKSMINEIRICFDKNLKLCDCDGIVADWNKYYGGVISNCKHNTEIEYPTVVPTVGAPVERPWKFPFVNFYKLIQLIKWTTL